MSSTERNKVKSFGDPSIDQGEMADRFLIVGAIMPPLLFQIGLNPNREKDVSESGINVFYSIIIHAYKTKSKISFKSIDGLFSLQQISTTNVFDIFVILP